MAHKHIFLTIVAMIVLMSLLVGCSSTTDTSIVWSDDFEDGDTEGWEQIMGDHYIEDGAVYFGVFGGTIYYPNAVKTGTWSFDAFLCEESIRGPDITFISSELGDNKYAGFTIEITKQPSFMLGVDSEEPDDVYNIGNVVVKELGMLTGWHHMDITRDDADNVKIYLDQALIYEFNQDYPYDSDGFFYHVNCEGPALDNVVVRNQVIDIQPPSE